MLSSLPRSRRRDADDDGRAEIAPTPFSACLIKRKGGLSVDEQKEVLPPGVMRCFDRTEPRIVQQGTFPTPRKKAPYRQHVCVNQTARNSQTQRRPGWGPGLLNSAWWEHAQCVGGVNVRGLAAPMKDQSRIPKCRLAGATTSSHALLHMLQGWLRMQLIWALRHLATKQCCIVTPNTRRIS